MFQHCRITALLVLVAGVWAAWGPANAETACDQPMASAGRAANALNYDPPRHYNTEKLAKDRAVAKWRELVAMRCPQFSNIWWRAHDRKLECEGYAGGIACEASAIPAKRLGF